MNFPFTDQYNRVISKEDNGDIVVTLDGSETLRVVGVPDEVAINTINSMPIFIPPINEVTIATIVYREPIIDTPVDLVVTDTPVDLVVTDSPVEVATPAEVQPIIDTPVDLTVTDTPVEIVTPAIQSDTTV